MTSIFDLTYDELQDELHMISLLYGTTPEAQASTPATDCEQLELLD